MDVPTAAAAWQQRGIGVCGTSACCGVDRQKGKAGAVLKRTRSGWVRAYVRARARARARKIVN
eukprot:3631188-Pleurochrysis_carterae.AAC.1